MNVFEGITDAQANKVVDGLSLKRVEKGAAAEQVKRLYELFTKSDCTLVEVTIIHSICPGFPLTQCPS